MGDAGKFDIRENAIDEELAYTCGSGLNDISGTSEVDYLMFRLPGSATAKAKILSFIIGSDAQNNRTIFRIYRKPVTTSNGTNLSEENLKIAPGSERSAEARCHLNPTVTDRGKLVGTFVIPDGNPSIPVERNYLIEPGQKLLITVENSTNNKPTHVDVDWLEIPI